MKTPVTGEAQMQEEDVAGHPTSLEYPWETSQRRDEASRLSKN